MKKENNEQKRIRTSVILGGIPFKVTSEGYEAETVGEETILYFSKLKKVLTLNATCTIIWNVLEKNEGPEKRLSEDDLLTILKEKYEIPEDAGHTVTLDIYKLFADLTHERVLHMQMGGAASESKDLKGILLSSVSKNASASAGCSRSAVKSTVGHFTGAAAPISRNAIGAAGRQDCNSNNKEEEDALQEPQG